jgi:hypothetical protein
MGRVRMIFVRESFEMEERRMETEKVHCRCCKCACNGEKQPFFFIFMENVNH